MENTIGMRIRQLRDAKKLSVADFAKAAGLKPSAVYGLESDANRPSLETVAHLRASFPDLNTEWLQFGEGDMYKDGRALTPIPAQQPDYTSGIGTVNTVVETLLRDRLADKQVIIDMLTAEVAELRGKPFDSPEAADEAPTEPNAPIFSGGGQAPSPWFRVQGYKRYAERR